MEAKFGRYSYWCAPESSKSPSFPTFFSGLVLALSFEFCFARLAPKYT